MFYPDYSSISLENTTFDLPAKLEIIKTKLRQVPDVVGVYYFMGGGDEPLYIGKSVHLRQRLLSHVAAAKDDERVAKYVTRAESICWRETVGDLHAQLLENREIKQRFPLFNRAQRRLKRFYTWQFSLKNPAQLELLSMNSQAILGVGQVCFGFYKNVITAKAAIKSLADREGLCLGLLGLEKFKGICFRAQINKCAGACAGRESQDEMLQRALESLLPFSFHGWPFGGLCQYEENGCWHALYQWQALGVFPKKLNQIEQKKLIDSTQLCFDKDEYRIIKRAIRTQAYDLIV